MFMVNDVKIGDSVKVQNNVSIYTGCEMEDEVFLGPSCVLIVPGITIGKYVFIGAGAVVTKDVPVTLYYSATQENKKTG